MKSKKASSNRVTTHLKQHGNTKEHDCNADAQTLV